MTVYVEKASGKRFYLNTTNKNLALMESCDLDKNGQPLSIFVLTIEDLEKRFENFD